MSIGIILIKEAHSNVTFFGAVDRLWVRCRQGLQPLEKVESCLTDAVIVKDEPIPYHTLMEQMKALHVLGVSVAIVHNGAIEWAPAAKPARERAALD